MKSNLYIISSRELSPGMGGHAWVEMARTDLDMCNRSQFVIDADAMYIYT
jgi:hypothetical protein